MASIPEQDTNSLYVRAVADGATAQLRAVIEHADRNEGRRIAAELKRIAAKIDRKFDFPSGCGGKRE